MVTFPMTLADPLTRFSRFSSIFEVEYRKRKSYYCTTGNYT